MKKLLLVTGDLATGKTTFSRKLAQRYNIPLIYKDRIKEILGDTVGFTNREENLRLSYATMATMIYTFEEIARSGGDLILEANFREGEMQELHRIASENDYGMLTIVLRAEDEILYKRFIHRIENENRHRVHISGGMENFATFKEYLARGREARVFGEAALVLADDFSYQEDGEVLSKIDSFMRNSENEN